MKLYWPPTSTVYVEEIFWSSVLFGGRRRRRFSRICRFWAFVAWGRIRTDIGAICGHRQKRNRTGQIGRTDARHWGSSECRRQRQKRGTKLRGGVCRPVRICLQHPLNGSEVPCFRQQLQSDRRLAFPFGPESIKKIFFKFIQRNLHPDKF